MLLLEGQVILAQDNCDKIELRKGAFGALTKSDCETKQTCLAHDFSQAPLPSLPPQPEDS